MKPLTNSEKFSAFFNTFIKYLLLSLCGIVEWITSLLTGKDNQQTPFLSEYQRSTPTKFFPNRNFNIAVDGPPLRLMNIETVLSVMMMPNAYLIRIESPEDRSCVKEEYFHEEPNYNSRFGQTDPNSSAGRWRACPTFYRI